MSSPLRVLQVVLTLGAGGTERLVIELIKRSLPDFQMAVLCLDQRGVWGEALQADGVTVGTLSRSPGFHPMIGRAVARAAAAHDATVIHCHQYSPFVYSCLARLWRPSLKVIFTEHGRLSDAPPSPKRRLANRVFRHGATAVFAVSHELKRHVVAEGFTERQTSVIYNGIDIGPLPDAAARATVRHALGIADDMVVIGTIARLDPVKDLGVLVKAVASLNARRPTVLLVIGDGSERASLELVAQEADEGRSTRFLGHRDDARDILAGCDIFANSSISEGVSLTILEAMAAGLPIVATRVGGTPEVIDDACGVLVPARDSAAMAAALRRLAESPEQRLPLGAVGRKRVETHFTLDRMIGEYRNAYLGASGL